MTDHDRATARPAGGRFAALAAWADPGAPHQVRGPFTRWPRATDGALVVIVFAVSVILVAVSRLADGDDLTLGSLGELEAGAYALLAVAAGALWWRRTRPIVVTGVVLGAMVAWALLDYGDGHDLALVVATYSVGRYTAPPAAGFVAVLVAAGISLLGTVIDAEQQVDVLPAILLTAVPWYVGRRVRNRGDYVVLLQERAARRETEQLARAREAVAAERSRIARELHDVVAHQVSMMTVQAGAARTVAHADLDAAVEAMGDVERAGRQALGELRHLLGVLRPDGGDGLGPQQGLAGVPALVERLTRAGADVTATLGDLPADLGAALDLSAFRIVQESVTNVIKHAGPHPTVDIAVGVVGDAIEIDVVNTVTGDAREFPDSGFGIAGMRERAALLGGTLTAGPEPPNRFRVHARLPLSGRHDDVADDLDPDPDPDPGPDPDGASR